MDDLISRQAAIEALDGEIEITGRTNAEAVKGYVRLVKDRLERLPSAQPERKKGKWINRSLNILYPEWERYTCSVCGEHSNRYDYCPNCGAKMDEEIEGRKK